MSSVLPATEPVLGWPAPAEPEAAARLTERFMQLGGGERRFAKTAEGSAVLAAIGGNAPYLADLAMAASGTLISTMTDGPDATFKAAISELQLTPLRTSRAKLMRALRLAKRRAALTIALAFSEVPLLVAAPPPRSIALLR